MFEKVPLRELTERITYGFTNPMPIASEGIFLLTAKDIIDGKINFNKARKTTVDAYNELLTDKSRPKIGDVLITKDGSIGRVAICDRDDLCINQSIAVARVNSCAEPNLFHGGGGLRHYLSVSASYQNHTITFGLYCHINNGRYLF